MISSLKASSYPKTCVASGIGSLGPTVVAACRNDQRDNDSRAARRAEVLSFCSRGDLAVDGWHGARDRMTAAGTRFGSVVVKCQYPRRPRTFLVRTVVKTGAAPPGDLVGEVAPVQDIVYLSVPAGQGRPLPLVLSGDTVRPHWDSHCAARWKLAP
ncbi:hypothetical protein AAFF_G00069860 [Aldrovandia affinis]|uniref:Uncharacterized protein n=1 Tax=Aldrovandia affinis TaxID=143900 RepID=A0AAD7VY32_9TELE|nr:hypothetical protein AAFF_G00069860 [Aldrovandia affinis]